MRSEGLEFGVWGAGGKFQTFGIWDSGLRTCNGLRVYMIRPEEGRVLTLALIAVAQAAEKQIARRRYIALRKIQ